jgi:uncharacterized protein YndB with AHSA1/START domain
VRPPADRVERATRRIAASPDTIFDVLATPREHTTVDGSGSVRSVVTAPERLELGSRFTMRMKLVVPYRMTSEVVEFDEPRLIAWRHLGGHVWRYRLEEIDGATDVTEEFDWRPSPVPWLLVAMRAPGRNAASLGASLDRLAAAVETTA